MLAGAVTHLRGNVVAYIALFFALGLGTAWALEANSVKSKHVKNNALKSKDLKDGKAVASADVIDDALTQADLASGAVRSAEVANNSLTGADVNEAALDATPLRTRAAQGGCQPTVAGTGQMVKVGPTCIDRYEASVWSSPTGGTQYGVSSDNYPCNDNGQNCSNIYARSVPGVTPSRHITWFQAAQALANSGKRLPTNAEWQAAVAGTPDSTACNVNTASVQTTGANASCVSRFGANDMVGNLWEWVADWDEVAAGCESWSAGYGSDLTCLGRGEGDANNHFPGALIRGGNFFDAANAGPFAVNGSVQPSYSHALIGLRGAR